MTAYPNLIVRLDRKRCATSGFACWLQVTCCSCAYPDAIFIRGILIFVYLNSGFLEVGMLLSSLLQALTFILGGFEVGSTDTYVVYEQGSGTLLNNQSEQI